MTTFPSWMLISSTYWNTSDVEKLTRNFLLKCNFLEVEVTSTETFSYTKMLWSLRVFKEKMLMKLCHFLSLWKQRDFSQDGRHSYNLVRYFHTKYTNPYDNAWFITVSDWPITERLHIWIRKICLFCDVEYSIAFWTIRTAVEK